MADESKEVAAAKAPSAPAYRLVQTGNQLVKADQALAGTVASNGAEAEDEFRTLYTGANTGQGVLAPPFWPKRLEGLVQQNNALGPCIEAMVTNIDGTGYTFEKDGDDTSTDKEDAKVDELLDFFKEPWPGQSFTTQRKALRRDQEQTGNAYYEVIKTPADEIVFLRPMEADLTRIMRLDAGIPVKKTVMRKGAERSVSVMIRERRFAQVVSGTKLIYFKEFGASRDLDKDTGYWAPTGQRLPANKRATEVIHFKVLPDVNTPYGVPRWIAQMPSILGSRKSEEYNLEFFENGGVPPVLILLQGGTLMDQTRKAFEQKTSGLASKQNRIQVIEVEPSAGTMDKPGQSKVTVERFGSERQADSMFEAYDEKCELRIRRSFRLPPIFVGMAGDYSFATAAASYQMAEAQVFAPEREEFDEIISMRLLPAMGYAGYKLKSNPLTIEDPNMKLAGIELGISTKRVDMEDIILAINEATGLNLKVTDLAKPGEQDPVTGEIVPDPNAPPPMLGLPAPGGGPPGLAGTKTPPANQNTPGVPERTARAAAAGLLKFDGEGEALLGLAAQAAAQARNRDMRGLQDSLDIVAQLDGPSQAAFKTAMSTFAYLDPSHDPVGLADLAGCTLAVLAAGSELRKGLGYNPYRDAQGHFTTKDKAGGNGLGGDDLPDSKHHNTEKALRNGKAALGANLHLKSEKAATQAAALLTGLMQGKVGGGKYVGYNSMDKALSFLDHAKKGTGGKELQAAVLAEDDKAGPKGKKSSNSLYKPMKQAMDDASPNVKAEDKTAKQKAKVASVVDEANTAAKDAKKEAQKVAEKKPDVEAKEPPKPEPDPAVQKWKKVGEKMGSNEGGTYENAKGEKVYAKVAKSEEHLKSELAANRLYEASGANTLNPSKEVIDGKDHVASKIVKVEKFDPDNPKHVADAKKDFAMHAVLGNRDAMGATHDNVGYVDGKLTNLDAGGALKFRAQGALKDSFGPKADEFESLRDPTKNAQTAKVFGNMTPKELAESGERLKNVSDATLKAFGDSTGDKTLGDTLVKRKADVLQRIADANSTAAVAKAVGAAVENSGADAATKKTALDFTMGKTLKDGDLVTLNSGDVYFKHEGKLYTKPSDHPGVFKEVGSDDGKMFHYNSGNVSDMDTGEFVHLNGKAVKTSGKAKDVPIALENAAVNPPANVKAVSFGQGAHAGAYATSTNDIANTMGPNEAFNHQNGKSYYKDAAGGIHVKVGHGSGHYIAANGSEKFYLDDKGIITTTQAHGVPGKAVLYNSDHGEKQVPGAAAPPSTLPTAPAAHQLKPAGDVIKGADGNTYWKHKTGVMYVKAGHDAGVLVSQENPDHKANFDGDNDVKHFIHNTTINKAKTGGVNPQGVPTAANPVPTPPIPKPIDTFGKAEPLKDTHGSTGQFQKLAGSITKSAEGKLTVTSSELAAMSDYQGSGYHAMNSALRQSEQMDPGMGKKITNLAKVIQKHVVPVEVAVYRGVGDLSVAFKGKDKLTAADIGTTVIDNGFMSVSTSRDFASSWAGGKKNPVVYEFKIPAGTKALPINNHTGSLANERELLLNRGTMLEVKGIRHESIGGKKVTIVSMSYE